MNFRHKAGELVELSSNGRKLQQNSRVVGMIGMVLRHVQSDQYPYIIQWFGFTEGDGTFPCKEYEIKRVRGNR